MERQLVSKSNLRKLSLEKNVADPFVRSADVGRRKMLRDACMTGSVKLRRSLVALSQGRQRAGSDVGPDRRGRHWPLSRRMTASSASLTFVDGTA